MNKQELEKTKQELRDTELLFAETALRMLALQKKLGLKPVELIR